MADKSAIEWTDASWSPIRARNLKTGKIGWHCEHSTTGCEFCYAEGMNKRLGTGLPFKPGHRKDIEIFLDDKMLLAPLRWRRPRMIFVCSMTDLFADFVKDEWIDKVFAVMALCPQHTFQCLTKRAERMRGYFAERWQGTPAMRVDFGGGDAIDMPAGGESGRREQIEEAINELTDNDWSLKDRFFDPDNESLWTPEGSSKALQFAWPLANVWLGVSCERQEEADARIPHLLQTPAAVRFVSAEPLLGPIDFTDHCNGYYFFDTLRGTRWHDDPERDNPQQKFAPAIDWVIVGGESGPKARPMDLAWPRSIVRQCKAAGVVCFVKQMGSRPDGWWTNELGPRFNRHTMKSSKGGDPSEWPTDLRVREMPHAS
jgi:protein gp37